MYVHYVRCIITLDTWNESVFPWSASRITMSTINSISSQIMSLTKSFHNEEPGNHTISLCLADLIILSCVSAGNWMKTSDGLSFNTTVTDIHPNPNTAPVSTISGGAARVTLVSAMASSSEATLQFCIGRKSCTMRHITCNLYHAHITYDHINVQHIGRSPLPDRCPHCTM